MAGKGPPFGSAWLSRVADANGRWSLLYRQGYDGDGDELTAPWNDWVFEASGTQTFSYTATGGLSLSGSAAQLRAALPAPAGGVVFAGAAPAARATVRETAGGLVFAGTSDELRKAEPASAGGVLFGGAGTYSSSSGGTNSYSYVADGGLTFAGVAVHANGRIVNSVGGIATGGAALLETRRAVMPVSGLVFGGSAGYVRIGGNVATRIYGIDLGAAEETVTEGTGSATTKGMELTVDMAKFLDKQSVLIALESLRNYIAEDNWPPG